MSRLVTVCVVCMVLIAGCAGSPASDDSGLDEGSGSVEFEESPTVVTYESEAENGTYTLEANHNNETYNMSVDYQLEPPYSNLSVDLVLAVTCGALQESAYNHTDPADTNATTDTTYTKTHPNGSTETVNSIPNGILADYTPQDVEGTIYAENETELASCTVDGPDSITTNDFRV